MALRLSTSEAKRLGISTGRARQPKRTRQPKSPPKPWWSLSMNVLTTVVSEANRREHWAAKKRRGDAQRSALSAALVPSGIYQILSMHRWPGPLTVTWVRVGRIGQHQEQDDDNLRSAFKVLRDEFAKWTGLDDGDPRIRWNYEQKAGEPGVELRVEYSTEAA